MARRRYLLAYDITEQRRLQLVARCAEAFGDRVQYSIFVCDLSTMELVHLKASLEALIDRATDRIMIIDLGVDDPDRFHFMGQRLALPDHSPQII